MEPVCRAGQLHVQENLQQIKVHPKISPCTCILYAYRLNICSPRVSYYLMQLGAPDRISCAPCTPSFFTLHTRDLVELCHALQTGDGERLRL